MIVELAKKAGRSVEAAERGDVADLEDSFIVCVCVGTFFFNDFFFLELFERGD